MSAATVMVCIFAYQSGFVANVPLAEVHLYREPVIVPCYWPYEKAQAFWWTVQGEDHPTFRLPPAELPARDN